MNSGNPAKHPGKYGRQTDINEEHTMKNYSDCPLVSGYDIVCMVAVDLFLRIHSYQKTIEALAMQNARMENVRAHKGC
jgi:hypothetical protein